ncbi:degenerin unc-8-like [Xenia sp. Carnegie-2017]|uniref:degenerin unc-8-like n=1 Tax=Xenia sp. Carnegie-2017 TaxID=2897299 RepID=UPI001F033D62|nr:degenerin unc-8-like [Xenia sp. Carnegie-2017]
MSLPGTPIDRENFSLPTIRKTRSPFQPSKKCVQSSAKKEGNTFRKLVLSFTRDTSAHGIGQLANSKTLLSRVFWSLVCMGALGMFVYQAKGLLQQYLSKPIATTVSVSFEKRLAFPAVTVCNLNMIRKDAVPQKVLKFLEKNYESWAYNNGLKNTRRRRDATQTTDSPSNKISSHGKSEYDSSEYDMYRVSNEDYESNSYDEDDKEEFPDGDVVDAEMKLFSEVEQMIGEMDETDLYEHGHQFNTMILNCSWKGMDCKSGNLSKFWTRRWNNKYGNCYTFNNGFDKDSNRVRVLKATKPGPSQGLVLIMNVEQEQYIGPFSVEAGVRVSLHGQGLMNFPHAEGFSASPGMSTSVGIKKTKITRLDRFNNKSCLAHDQLPKINIYRRFRNITIYSQQACLQSCLALSQRIRCKCSEASYPSTDPCDLFNTATRENLQTASATTLSKFKNLANEPIHGSNANVFFCADLCLRKVKNLFNKDKLPCIQSCRQPLTICTSGVCLFFLREEVIQKTISSSTWPSKAYKKYLKEQGLEDGDSENLLRLNVFYSELNHEKIEESFSYGTVNLLADIGGQLGLWIGISAITVCELLQLIVMLFAVCLWKLKDSGQIGGASAYH